MTRPIDADALSEKLYETTIFIKDGAMFQRMINDAPTVPLEASAWIPVGERLPEEDGWYLVTVQGYETVTDVSLYSADGSAWGDVSTKQKVNAWMPLPEPYKEGTDAQNKID